jgi:hypothetical protein
VFLGMTTGHSDNSPAFWEWNGWPELVKQICSGNLKIDKPAEEIK